MRLELVRDWMTRDVIVVEPETPLKIADELMIKHTIRRLPVLDKDQLVGIVTYGDIRAARPSEINKLNQWERQYLIAELIIAEVMTPDPVTVVQDVSVGEAAQLLLKHRIGSLPVLDSDGNVVGIITESDIFRLVVHDWMHAGDESTEPYTHYG